MANPQIEDGYIRIANELWNEVLRRDFSKRQQNIILFIWRLSYGTGQKDCHIPKFTFFEIVGVYKQDVKKELKYLRECSVLNWDEKSMVFSINKHYKNWQINPIKNWDLDKFNDLIHHNLQRKKVSKTLTNEGDTKNKEVRKTLTFLSEKVSKTLTYKFVKHLPRPSLKLDEARVTSALKTVLKTSFKDNVVDNARVREEEKQKMNIEEYEKKVIDRYIQLRAKYFKKGTISGASPKDQDSANEIASSGIPLDTALNLLEQSFKTYEPQHSRDSINSLSYCTSYIFNQYFRKKEIDNVKKLANYRRPQAQKSRYGNTW